MSAERDLPAILGGAAVRPEGPPAWPFPREDVRAAIETAWREGWWGAYHGPASQALVDDLRSYLGVEYVELVCSGTFAVELALRSLQLAPGDEVILAAYDYVGNFHDVVLLGGVPVLVDLAAANWNLDPARIHSAIGPKTRGILVSHLHSGIAPMRSLMEIARDAGLWVVEDAAQATGAMIDGRRAGTWGDAGVISFGGSKLLSAGRGGAVLTQRPEVQQRAKLYCQRGNHAFAMTELQAAIVRPQLATLGAENVHRAEAVEYLRRELADLEFLNFLDNEPGNEPAYYKLGMKYIASELLGLSADVFAAAVRAEGFALDRGFRALHRTRSSRRYRAAGTLDVADQVDTGMLVLHHPILLGEAADIDGIVRAIRKIAANADALSRVHRYS